MNNLTTLQKGVILVICNLQLKSLGDIFLSEEDVLTNSIQEKDPEIELEEFLSSLVQNANYWKKLKDNPNKYFGEIDESDAEIMLLVLSLKWKKEFLQNPEVIELIDYLEEVVEVTNQEESFDINLENIVQEIESGENNEREFKPSLLYHYNKKKGSQSVLYVIAKAICGFLNSNGGVLYIGVRDDGTIQGLDSDYNLFQGDYYKKKDFFRLAFDNLIKHYFGSGIHPLVNLEIIKFQDMDIAYVKIAASINNPVFLKNRKRNPETGKYDIISKEFFYRADASTLQIEDMEELLDYVKNKWWLNSTA